MRLVLWIAAQSGCDGLNTKSTLQVRLSARDNQIIYTVASFFRVFTGARPGKQAFQNLPAPDRRSVLQGPPEAPLNRARLMQRDGGGREWEGNEPAPSSSMILSL